MKRIATIIPLLLCLSLFSFSQSDSTNFEKLLTQFSQEYAAAKDPAANYVAQLEAATNIVMQVTNPVFYATENDFNALLKWNNEDSILIKIADSIYKRYVAAFFWQDQRVELVKYRNIFSFYNDKFCPCISSRLSTGFAIRELERIITDCDNSLSADGLFVIRLQNELKNIPLEERKTIQSYLSKFAYENCPWFTRAINISLFNKVLENHTYFFEDLSYNLEKRITTLYRQNKIDSLRLIFPDYISYKKDIEKSSSLIQQGKDYITDNGKDNPPPGIKYQVVTFYEKGKKIKLLGQVVATFTVESLALKVKAYQFIPPDKIKNAAEILEDLNIEPPPPPPQELLEMPIKKKGT